MDGSSITDPVFDVAAAELRQFVERVEALEAEKKGVSDQIKEVFAEMKARGYLVMPVRAIIKERRRKPDELAEEQAVLEMYRSALGMG